MFESRLAADCDEVAIAKECSMEPRTDSSGPFASRDTRKAWPRGWRNASVTGCPQRVVEIGGRLWRLGSESNRRAKPLMALRFPLAQVMRTQFGTRQTLLAFPAIHRTPGLRIKIQNWCVMGWHRYRSLLRIRESRARICCSLRFRTWFPHSNLSGSLLRAASLRRSRPNRF